MSRKRKSDLRLEHRTLGFGAVKHRKSTDGGNALVIRFEDGVTRTVLLEIDGVSPFVNPADALTAYENASDPPKPQAKPRKPKRVRRAEDVLPEPEPIAAEEE